MIIKKRLTCFSGHYEDYLEFRLCCRDRSFLWISEHNATNKRLYFGYKNYLYGTKGTFVV